MYISFPFVDIKACAPFYVFAAHPAAKFVFVSGIYLKAPRYAHPLRC